MGRPGDSVLGSFWDIESSGQAASGAGIGLTAAQMRDVNTFLDAGWNFENTWSICQGIDTPRLQWEQRICP
jgi:hypothetical protein